MFQVTFQLHIYVHDKVLHPNKSRSISIFFKYQVKDIGIPKQDTHTSHYHIFNIIQEAHRDN